MKIIKNLTYFSIATLLLLSFGCKKDENSANQPNNPSGGSLANLTVTIDNVTSTEVSLIGNITSDGGSTVTERGFCYDVFSGPTTGNTSTNNGSGTGTFSSTIDSLLPNVTYHVRAYAINSFGIAYSSEETFYINALSPTLTTTAASNVSYTSATIGGNISSDGGTTVTARGICYSENPNPTINDSSIFEGTGTGTFTINLDSLNAGHTYHFRAYATSLAGTFYGSDEQFTTTASPYTIGQVYGGGVIYHIYPNGMHGLISSTTNQGTSITWGLSGVVGTTDDGQANTTQIVNSVGPGNYAASICQSLVLNGYNDWYLPSIGELHLLFEQRNVVGGFNGPAFYFWSSTGYALDNSYAEATGFINGYTAEILKTELHAVRAIRKF